MIVQSGVIDSCPFGSKQKRAHTFVQVLMAPRTGLENERSELVIAQQYHSDIVQHSPKAKLTVVCVANNEC